MRYFYLFLFVLSSEAYSNSCSIKTENVLSKNIEEVQNYALDMKKKSCAGSALKEIDNYLESDPRFYVLKGFLLAYVCEVPCDEKVWNNIQNLDKRACQKGYIDACFASESAEMAGKKDSSMEFAYKLCDKNASNACAVIGFDLLSRGDMSWKKYLEKACSLKLSSACDFLKTMK